MIRMDVHDAEVEAQTRYKAAVRAYESAVAANDQEAEEVARQDIKRCRLELDGLQEMRQNYLDFVPPVAQPKRTAQVRERPGAGVGGIVSKAVSRR